MLLPFGGLEAFVYPEDKVFLKPSARRAVPPHRGENTDPGFVEAVIMLCFEAGASQVMVGENPEDEPSALEASGLAEAARRTGAELLDLSACTPVKRNLSQALFMEELEVYPQPFTADVFINLPKLKTDAQGALDCAAANLAMLLSRGQREILQQDTGRGLVDVLNLFKPDLHLVDGILASRAGRPLPGDVVLAGIDTVTVDAVAAALLGLDISALPHLILAEQYGLGICDSGDISIFGADLRPIMQKLKGGGR